MPDDHDISYSGYFGQPRREEPEARDLPRIVRDTLVLMARQVEAATREMNPDDPDFWVSSTIAVQVGDITITAGWQWNRPDTAVPVPL